MRFESYPATKLESADWNFVFHHIGKTGGTSFSGIIWAMAFRQDIDAVFLPASAKPGWSAIDKGSGELRDFDRLIKGKKIVVGHSGIVAWEKRLKKTHKLATLVRKPAARVTSDYFWRKKERNAIDTIDEKDFEKFIMEESNKNICSKSILSASKSAKSTKEDLIRYLEDNKEGFLYIGTTEDLKTMAETFLSHFMCINIEMPKAKEEENALKKEFAKKYEEEINHGNELDSALAQWAEDNQEIFKSRLNRGPNRSKYTAKYVNTAGKRFSMVDICHDGNILD